MGIILESQKKGRAGGNKKKTEITSFAQTMKMAVMSRQRVCLCVG